MLETVVAAIIRYSDNQGYDKRKNSSHQVQIYDYPNSDNLVRKKSLLRDKYYLFPSLDRLFDKFKQVGVVRGVGEEKQVQVVRQLRITIMVMVVMIVILMTMIVTKCLSEEKEDLTLIFSVSASSFKGLRHLKATSGIVESMKTTVERMTTAIDVNAYS